MSITIESTSDDTTRAIGRKLALALGPGDVVGLIGDLGAGKTTFVKGLALGLGVPAHVYVNSPTFTIVNDYPTSPRLVHFDFYRLSDPDELIETGWDDYISGEAICVVEWIDTLPEAAPDAWLEVRISDLDNGRRLEFIAHGDSWQKRLEAIARDEVLAP